MRWRRVELDATVPTSSARVKKSLPRNSSIASKSFFPCTSQAQVGLQDVAVLDATDTHWEFVVNASTDSQAFHVLSNQGQSGIGGEVVGQLF